MNPINSAPSNKKKKNWGHTKKRHFPYGGRESGKTWLLIIPGSVIIVTISSIQILEQNKLGIFLILKSTAL